MFQTPYQESQLVYLRSKFIHKLRNSVRAECLQKVHEHFCSIYRPNIDPHFEKYVAIIDQNHKMSEKYEHG